MKMCCVTSSAVLVVKLIMMLILHYLQSVLRLKGLPVDETEFKSWDRDTVFVLHSSTLKNSKVVLLHSYF